LNSTIRLPLSSVPRHSPMEHHFLPVFIHLDDWITPAGIRV
jgi:hypothetical protein